MPASAEKPSASDADGINAMESAANGFSGGSDARDDAADAARPRVVLSSSLSASGSAGSGSGSGSGSGAGGGGGAAAASGSDVARWKSPGAVRLDAVALRGRALPWCAFRDFAYRARRRTARPNGAGVARHGTRARKTAHPSEGTGQCGRTEGRLQGRAEAGGTQRTARQKLLMDRHFVAVRRFRVLMTSQVNTRQQKNLARVTAGVPSHQAIRPQSQPSILRN